MESWKVMLLVTAIFESFFAIPILGGGVIFLLLWLPLIAGLILHIITLVLVVDAKKPKYASIVGIVTSILGFIPVLGWLLHLTTAILLWVVFAKN